MERLRSGDPEQIGPWQIVNRLGSGGMGIVYMGTNGTRAAAIKVVREFLLEDPASRTRLAREVDTLLRVKSDFVAEIVGSDINGNPAWIATNYVDGPSLKILIEKEGPLSESAWIDFAKGFLSALTSVHTVGVVHRDIKPSNILLSKSGPKLIDFGISFVNDATSLTGTGMVAGTPAWLAPEQFLGREITTAVDNFAAGSTLMYAATGKTPWGADDSSVGAVMHTILVEEPDTTALTDFQMEIITPLLIKDVLSRKTASQMLKKLNDGPKSSALRSKKEIKAAVPVQSDTFLDKARKKDLEDKRAKQEAELKKLQDDAIAAERQANELIKREEKERIQLAKDAEKQLANQAKEKSKQVQAQEKQAKKLKKLEKSSEKEIRPPQKASQVKFTVGLIVVSIVGVIAFISFKNLSNAQNVPNPTVTVAPTYSWSALIAGESEAQTGAGTSFETFVCDQNVLSSSLQVKNISDRPKNAGKISVKLLKKDARCGNEFDTILISGVEAKQAGSVNYFVSGKSSSNLDFRYDFSVTVLPD